MKTRFAIIALLLTVAAGAAAQNALVLDNSFISVSGGINTMYVHNHGDGYNPIPAFGYDISAGKWFSPSFAVRAGLQGGNLREEGILSTTITEMFGFVHADLLWNATTSIHGYRKDRIFSLIPYMQIGAIGLFKDESYINGELAAAGGLLGSFRLSDRISATLDLRALGYDADGCGNPTDYRTIVPSLFAGLSYSLGESGWDYSEGALYDHSFIQVGGGALKLRGSAVAPMFQAAFGRWLSPTFGGRVAYQSTEDMKYVHGDFLWNILNFAGGVKDRIINIVPYASAGVAHSPYSTVEFTAGGGVLGTLRFCDRVAVFADLQGMLVNGRLNGRTGINIALAAMAGLQFNVGETTWQYSPVGEERSRRESDVLGGMFINFGGGINSLYSTVSGFEWFPEYGPAVELELGKWFTPRIGARIGYQGARLATPASGNSVMRSGFAYGHADLLWNATNALFGYKGARFFTLSPYAHMGLLAEYSGIRDNEFAAGAGLLGNFNLCDRAGIFVDLRNFLYRGMISPKASPRPAFWASALAGISYNLGEYDWTVNPSCEFLANTFIAAGAGVNTTVQRGQAGISYEAFAGKWFTPTVGGRIGWRGGNINTNGYTIGEDYFHGDFLWDATASAFGANADRIWQLAPYASMGVIRTADRTDGLNAPIAKEFAAGAGIYNRFRLSDRVGAYLDFGAILLNARSGAMKIGSYPIDITGTLGLAYNVGGSCWKSEDMSLRRSWVTPRETVRKGEWIISRRLVDNSFVSVTGGVNSMWAPGLGAGYNGGVSPAMELMAGMWFNPSFGGRIGAHGINASVFASDARNGVYEGICDNGKNRIETAYTYLHGDLLWNLSNAIFGYRSRVWEFIPYGSAGFFVNCPTETADPDNHYRIDIAAGPGLVNRFNLNARTALDLDLRALLIGAYSFPAEEAHKSILASASMGLTYSIGRPDWVSAKSPFAPAIDGRRRNAEGFIANSRLVDNTFITASAGAHFAVYGEAYGRGETFDIAAGKWFSPMFAGRIGYQDCRYAGKTALSYLHMDMIGDATNILLGYNPDRIVSVEPYLSIGCVNRGRYSTPVKAGAGLIGNIRLDERLSLNAEARAILLNRANIDATVMFGMNYHIGATDWERANIRGEEPDSLKNYPKLWAVSTNLVDYVDGTFNLEAQCALGRHWSADARIGSNTHSYGADDRQDQKQFVALGARFWPWYTYSGIWFRADAQVQTYHASGMPWVANGIVEDRAIPERGNAYGAGLSLGYALMVTKWFNLDFGAGIWGGVKNFAQYSDATFSTPLEGQGFMTKGFFSLNTLSLSASFVF